MCVGRGIGGRNGSCLIKGKDISISVCSRQMITCTITMILPDIFSFIHNAVCSLTEVGERGSDLEINHTADTVDFTKFSPGCSINPAEGILHLHFRDLVDALISCQ